MGARVRLLQLLSVALIDDRHPEVRARRQRVYARLRRTMAREPRRMAAADLRHCTGRRPSRLPQLSLRSAGVAPQGDGSRESISAALVVIATIALTAGVAHAEGDP